MTLYQYRCIVRRPSGHLSVLRTVAGSLRQALDRMDEDPVVIAEQLLIVSVERTDTPASLDETSAFAEWAGLVPAPDEDEDEDDDDDDEDPDDDEDIRLCDLPASSDGAVVVCNDIGNYYLDVDHAFPESPTKFWLTEFELDRLEKSARDARSRAELIRRRFGEQSPEEWIDALAGD